MKRYTIPQEEPGFKPGEVQGCTVRPTRAQDGSPGAQNEAIPVRAGHSEAIKRTTG